jgi:pimeloyl-ACP methyl ester carboxylesterase
MLYVQHKTTVHGVESRMLRGGTGDTVLFLHGAGGLSGWLDYFDRLAHRFDVLAPEHPGFGKNERPEWITSVADLARYYKTFCAGLGRIHLIGSSMGGWLASELAMQVPEAIRSLTLIAPAGMRARAPGSGPGALPSRAERLRRFYFDQSFVDRVLAQDPHDIQKIEAGNYATTELLGGPGFHDPSLQESLGRLNCPTLVLWGEEDRVVSVAQAKLWSDAVAGAEVHVFSRCGHLPHVEMSEAAASLTQAFIQRSASQTQGTDLAHAV